MKKILTFLALFVSVLNHAYDLYNINTTQGQLPEYRTYQNQNQITVDISSFPQGIYMLIINNLQPIKVIKI